MNKSFIQCPECRKKTKVKNPRAGQVIRCKCGQRLMITEDDLYYIDEKGAIHKRAKKPKIDKALKKSLIKAKNILKDREKERVNAGLQKTD